MAGVRFQEKRGTAQQWLTANPVLSDGEFGIERDTGVVKVGDGLRNWNDLPPILGSTYLPILGKAADSEKLDGLDSTAFLQKTEATQSYLLQTDAANTYLAASAPVSAATANAPVKRDAQGSSAFNEVTLTGQTAATSGTRKDYVDTAVAGAKIYADSSASTAANTAASAAVTPLTTGRPYWLFTGGNGQAVATNTETEYVPTVFDSVGVTRSGGRVTITTAGYYIATFGTRINAVGTVGERYIAILQYRGGSMLRRVGMHNITNAQVALSTTSQFRVQASDQLYAVMYQVSGASTNANDVVAELNFGGHMVRPL